MANIDRDDGGSMVSSISLASEMSVDDHADLAMSSDSLMLSPTSTHAATRPLPIPPKQRVRPPPSPSSSRTGASTAAHTPVVTDDKERSKLLKDIEELERLNVAYQKDNVALHSRIHTLEVEKRQYEAEIAELKRMNKLNNQEQEDIIGSKQSKYELEIAELKRTVAKLQETRRPLEQVERERDELKNVIKDLKKDLDSALSKIQDESKIPKYELEIADLRRQVAWYIENQRLIDDYEKERDELKAVIRDLRRDLDIAQTSSGTVGADDRGSGGGMMIRAKDQKRIKELESQVEHLEQVVAKRHPNSIGELIRASKPSAEESKQMVLLQQRVKDAEKGQADAENKLSQTVRSLRQEHEKMKKIYEKKISDLETNSSKLNKAGGSAQVAKIKELEKTVSDLRSFYIKKVRSLSEQLKKAGIKAVDDSEKDPEDLEPEQPPVQPAEPAKIKTGPSIAPASIPSPSPSPAPSKPMPMPVPHSMISLPLPLPPPLQPQVQPSSAELSSLHMLVDSLETALYQSRTENDDAKGRIAALEYALSKSHGLGASRPPTPSAPVAPPVAPPQLKPPTSTCQAQTEVTIHPQVDSRIVPAQKLITLESESKTLHDSLTKYEQEVNEVR